MLESDDGAPRRVRPALCARCFKPVDPLDPNAQRNPKTQDWEHKECRASPRVYPHPPGPTAR
jgi:hypothetical protein